MNQLAELMGFSADERVLFRLAMAAWMLPTNDHSVYEILLGAEGYMPADARMVSGVDDIGQFMPRDIPTRDGTFRRADVWATVGKVVNASAAARGTPRHLQRLLAYAAERSRP